jgi:DNA-binding NarL/FixJ family response regulator
MIRTLIVDDDFRVAGAHAGFVEEVFGFTVVGTAHTAAEARARVRELSPDLVLLDRRVRHSRAARAADRHDRAVGGDRPEVDQDGNSRGRS